MARKARIAGQNAREHVRRPFLIAGLLSVTVFSCSAVMANAPDKLGSIENVIVGSKNNKGSIESRIKSLEMKVFGKVQTGSLSTRIAALEKFAGLAENKSSDFMPPLPPQFDNGQGPLKQAPERTAGKPHEKPRAVGTKHSPTSTAHSGSTDQQLEKAVQLHHDGKVQEAEFSLRKILQDNPQNADAYFSLGAIAESRGDMQSALEYYTSAMQTNPNDTEAQEAVAELSRKITAAKNQTFVNPLYPPEPSPPGTPLLKGNAWQLTSAASSDRYRGHAPLSVSMPQVPTAAVSQPNQQRSGAMRNVTRALLMGGLSAAGLHCPACQILRGF